MIPYVPSAIVAVAAPAPPACTVEVQSPNGSPSTLQSLQSNSLNETAAMPGGGVRQPAIRLVHLSPRR